MEFVKSITKSLGPGFIAGAADDDPSGIATYSQAGAQFGYGLLWSLFLTYPLMVGIQLIAARLGRVTGIGIAGNMRRYLPLPVVIFLVTLLLVANLINIAADLAAMGEGLQLLIGGGEHGHALVFGLLAILFQLFVPYKRMANILKWLTLTLLSYVATVFVIHVPWLSALKGTVLPTFQWNYDYWLTVVAVLGTTISPYLFFWQAAQENEERIAPPYENPLRDVLHEAPRHLRRMKIDAIVGMGFSNLVAFFIMLTTAAVLNAEGITNIQTASQAAEALRPLAGEFTFVLFAFGIIGTGMLAIPVLAGSAAYAIAETMDWKHGLDLKPMEAKGFYSIIVLATILGVALDFTPIDPVKALFWSAVINGLIAAPIMAAMMYMAASRKIMGSLVITPRLRFLGWAATAIMAAASVILIASGI